MAWERICTKEATKIKFKNYKGLSTTNFITSFLLAMPFQKTSDCLDMIFTIPSTLPSCAIEADLEEKVK